MASVISILTKDRYVMKEIQKLLPKLSLHFVENTETDDQFKKSSIIVADFDLLLPHIYELPNAKWVQGTWAGVDTLLKSVRPNQPPNMMITRFSGKHFGNLMSEYVISNIINQERAFFEIKENQRKSFWLRDGKISSHRTLPDLIIGIMGLGHIGNKIAEKLNFLGAKVIGFGRKPSLQLEDNKHIAGYYSGKGLSDFLKKCDYFVNVLPSTEETRGLLNGNVLESCKDRSTVFINIGRGSIVSENCLVEALRRKWLAGAILDVHEQEPLRKESPLWAMENVFITPHVSGVSLPRHVAEHFAENYQKYEQNLPVGPLIDFAKGY